MVEIPFHKTRFSVEENEFPADDHVLIHVYAKGNDFPQFIIPFKTISEIKEFSDGLLRSIDEIKENYPDFVERNK